MKTILTALLSLFAIASYAADDVCRQSDYVQLKEMDRAGLEVRWCEAENRRKSILEASKRGHTRDFRARYNGCYEEMDRIEQAAKQRWVSKPNLTPDRCKQLGL